MRFGELKDRRGEKGDLKGLSDDTLGRATRKNFSKGIYYYVRVTFLRVNPSVALRECGKRACDLVAQQLIKIAAKAGIKPAFLPERLNGKALGNLLREAFRNVLAKLMRIPR